MRSRCLLALTFLLLLAVAPLSATCAPAADSLEKGEALLKAMLGPRSRADREPLGQGGMEAAEQAARIFRRHATAPATASRALADLARLQMAQGQYAEAVTSAQAAVRETTGKAAPTQVAARALLARARESLGAAQGAKSAVPPGNRLLRVERLVGAGRDASWVVLSARTGKVDATPFDQFGHVTVQVMRRGAGGLRQVWRDVVTDSRFGEGPVNALEFYVRDLTGDGVPDIAVMLTVYGASWMPSYLRVYRGGTLPPKTIAGIWSSFPLWMESLHHDGTWQVGNYREIGWTLAHVEQPLWTDVYAWDPALQRFEVANPRFPELFRKWPAELKELLAKHPDDFQLIQHLGLAYQATGQRAQARAAYESAALSAERAMAACGDDPAQVKRIQAQLREIRRQTVLLSEP